MGMQSYHSALDEAEAEGQTTEKDVLANGRDAMAWTDDFIRMCPGASGLDRHTVFGWFANIIEQQYATDLEGAFLRDTRSELNRARDKFPSATASTVALMEEVGELAQAMLKHAAGKWPHSRVMEEAVQVAVMAMRVALEGDESLAKAKYTEPGE